jgi:hypothetical protein
VLIDKKTKHKHRMLTERKIDDIGASSNPWTEEELRENICREISNIAAENLQKVNENLFHWCKECLRVEGQHFQHLLLSVNKGKNFPSFHMLLACWVIDRILVHRATSDEGQSHEHVNFIKILPVLEWWIYGGYSESNLHLF